MYEQIASLANDPEKVIFTQHSINRFKYRYEGVKKTCLVDPEKLARRLLSYAKKDEVISDQDKKIRFKNNNFLHVFYLYNSGWRFIVSKDNDVFVVITIEINRYEEKELV